MLFPERRYLLAMIISLLLILNPVMVFMYFRPPSFENRILFIIADMCNGIGIHAILGLWLCLLHGLRYHTAEMTRRRVDNKKRQVKLWNSIRYLKSSTNESTSRDEPSSKDLLHYYNEYGDSDGIGNSWTALRMKHDPCGDNWPDFLIPKLLLFALGVAAVSTASRYKYYDATLVESHTLHWNHKTYAISSLLHMVVLIMWVVLIIRASVKTGDVLRKEPFLSTRPAQLVYRILMNMIFLGALSFFVLFLADVYSLLKVWESNQHSTHLRSQSAHPLFYRSSTNFNWNSDHDAAFDVFFKLVLYAKQRIPYIGAAIGLGSGEMLFITMCTLTVAFIFLPSTNFFLNSGRINGMERKTVDGKFIQSESQRRDKRMLVTLSR